MKVAFQLAAFFIWFICLALWFFGGLHLGRSHIAPSPSEMGRIPNVQLGIDFLAVATVVSALLYGVALWTRSSKLEGRRSKN